MTEEEKLNITQLIPYTLEELDRAIDESPDGETIVLCTCQFVKELKYDSEGIEPEHLVFIADVRKYDENSYLIRPNRNTFRGHEFGNYEEHQWRREKKGNLTLYNPFALGFKAIIPMSLGCTINIKTGKMNPPEYTWSIRRFN